MYKQRMEQLDRLLSDHAFDAIILIPGSNLQYLTGLSFHLLERPVLLFVAPGNKPTLIVPELEKAKAESTNLDIELVAYGEDVASRTDAFTRVIASLGKTIQHVGVDPLVMRFHELSILKEISTSWEFSSAHDLLLELRLIKNEGEVELMREAVAIAEAALRANSPITQGWV